MSKQPTREEQAMREVGQTAVTPSCAAVLAAVFIMVMLSAGLIQSLGGRTPPWQPLVELGRDLRGALRQPVAAESVLGRGLTFNRRLLAAMHAWEAGLEDNSLLGQAIRPVVQYGLARWLGAGNEQAYCGRERWLFYRPDVDYLIEPGFLDPARLARRRANAHEWVALPQPDPRPALLDLQAGLRDRGIELLLLPVPAKPMVHPEKLAAAGAAMPPPPRNRSYERFMHDLRDAGLPVYDGAAELLKNAAAAAPQYLATDTHWRPQALRLVAEDLARFIREWGVLPEQPPTAYNSVSLELAAQGDIAAMLRLPDGQDYYADEQVLLEQVRDQDGLWQADPGADVLVLGDSFANIYSLESMGWGEAAGFVEHLSLALQRPLDRIAINDNAAYAARALLQRELARGRDRLAGKRLVIYQFAVRELAGGDWRVLPLQVGQPTAADFVRVAAGEELRARAVVVAVSPAPRPGAVPYRDHLVSLHLADVTGASEGAQALVYAWSMRDNVRQPAAGCRPGETVEVVLRAWDDVAAELDGLNRSELDDLELQLQEPLWAAELQ
ncbi:MAG: hypothetical protein ABR497_12300, partial [Kiritimatiellia bacterium]